MKTVLKRRTAESQNGYHSNSSNNNNSNNSNNNNNNVAGHESVIQSRGLTTNNVGAGFKFGHSLENVGKEWKCTKQWTVYLFPVLACLLCYSNALNGDFVHDDVFAIRENRDVIATTSEWSWRRLLTDDFWGAPLRSNSSHKSYRPLCILTYRLNFLVSRLDPRPYHVVNLALHIVCTILVCYISQTIVFVETAKTKAKTKTSPNNGVHIANGGSGISRKKMAVNCDRDSNSNHQNGTLQNCTDSFSFLNEATGSGSIWRTTGSGSGWAAMMTALIFAVHPIHTEAVTGLVGRADVLACCFLLTSFITHHCAISSTSPNGRHFGSYVLSVVMATAAMLSKEHGVMALVVNSAHDVITAYQDGLPDKLHRKSRCRWWRCRYRVLGNAFTFLTLFYCRWLVMGSQLPLFNETDNPAAFASSLRTRLLTFLYLPVFNTYLLLYPRTLSYDWQYGSIPLLGDAGCLSDVRAWSVPAFYGVLALLVWRAVRYLKNRTLRPLQYGLLLLCVPFVPATNLFFTVGFVVAERVLYIPSVGYCLLVGCGLRAFATTAARRRFVSFLVSVVVIIMIGRTLDRNTVWRHRETLFRSGVETLPNNAKMHYNYANYLRDADKSEEAIRHFREAIRLYPKFASAHNNLGLLLTTDPKEAERCYRTTIKFNPKHANAHLNLGVMYMNSGHRSLGLPLLEKAAELYPRYSLHLANAFISVGKDLKALETLRNGVAEHQLHDAETLRLYTQQLVRAGLYEEAEVYVEQLTKATDLNLLVQTLVDKALILYNTQRQAQATEIIERAARSTSEAETLKELSHFYQKTNQNDKALSLLEKARNSEPENPTVLHATAISLSALERYDDAERLFMKILSMEAEDVDVLRGLSSMYGAQKRHREGLSVIDKSVRVLEKRVPGVEVELVKALNMKASHERDLQQYYDAAKTYQRLLEFDGDNVHARINLGAILHLQGNLEEARVHYVIAERLSPENKLVRENLQKVDRLLQRRHTT